MIKAAQPLANELHPFTHFSVRDVIGGYRARYPAISDFVFQYEGGYVNDPNDPGGCTNMGITHGTLSAWRGTSVSCDDVYNLTKFEASLIYATNYWSPIWGNQLPVGINCQVYDFGVNAGTSRSIRILQDCVGTTQDGIMGPKTLSATAASDQDSLIAEFTDKRQAYYESLDNFGKYGNGWTNRNSDCYALAMQLNESGMVTLPSFNPDHEDRITRLENWAASFGIT